MKHCHFQVLPKLQELEVINFGDCLLRNGGAKSLASALKKGQDKLRVSKDLAL
jgi:Ran GTPase-activating protein 1